METSKLALLIILIILVLLIVLYIIKKYCYNDDFILPTTGRDQPPIQLTTTEPEDPSQNISDRIAEAQKLFPRPLNVELIIAQVCSLIIAVDATPATSAGYCIDLKRKQLEYYVIKRDDLPWVLHSEKDPSEFEMKNFMFALVVWKELILKYKRIAIYTDNMAITRLEHFDKTRYGQRAYRLLSHYVRCEGVNVVNMDKMAINKNKRLKDFAMFLQPADDLSRWQISAAIKFLTELYDIDQENVKGTHYMTMRGRAKNKPHYDPLDRYQEILERANEIINSHDCRDQACPSKQPVHVLQSSLRRN